MLIYVYDGGHRDHAKKYPSIEKLDYSALVNNN